jgi:hypothetical protein
MDPTLPAHEPTAPPERPLRLVIVGTPRSGNTWLRHLLMTLYDVRSEAIHAPEGINWADLPASLIVQIHWPPTPAFQDLLREHQFQAVTLARHPLDVLLSILHFSTFDESTSSWLLGAHGTEDNIFAALPSTAVFQEYAVSARAAALLALSCSWAAQPGSCHVRYEDLVEAPAVCLQRVAKHLPAPMKCSVDRAVASNTFSKLKAAARARHHFWQGQPGLWKKLLPAAMARQIADVHPEGFALFGYACDADPALSVAQADANWLQLVRDEFAAGLRRQIAMEQMCAQLQAELAEAKARLAKQEADILNAQSGLARSRADALTLLRARAEDQKRMEELCAAVTCAREKLMFVDALHPLPFQLAWKLQNLAARFPRLSSAVKGLLGAPEVRSSAPRRLGRQ